MEMLKNLRNNFLHLILLYPHLFCRFAVITFFIVPMILLEFRLLFRKKSIRFSTIAVNRFYQRRSTLFSHPLSLRHLFVSIFEYLQEQKRIDVGKTCLQQLVENLILFSKVIWNQKNHWDNENYTANLQICTKTEKYVESFCSNKNP